MEMNKIIIVVAAASALSALAVTNEELAKLVAEDVAKPVRPAQKGGQPFWNGQARFSYYTGFQFYRGYNIFDETQFRALISEYES